MTEELKPCPFCGDEDAQLIEDKFENVNAEHNYDIYYGLACVCGIVIPYSVHKNRVIKAWNKRVSDEDNTN